MGTKVIKITLDSASVGKAITEVKKYKEDLIKAINALVFDLTSEGSEIATLKVLELGAFDTGELADSMRIEGVFNEDTHIGIIRSGSYYAVYVEFGTGVVGKNGPQHQWKSLFNWEHDINNHGNDGWKYISDRDGKLHWTKGQESRPFMYETYKELMRIAGERLRSINI